jgi:hypothetical protein
VAETPNIDHLIRARYVELGFSDEFIEEIEAFTKAEAERIKKMRLNDGCQCPPDRDSTRRIRINPACPQHGTPTAHIDGQETHDGTR